MVSGTASPEEEGEWEWEYEEVPEDEILAAGVADEEEGWEYVEVPEDEAAEEEWEYVDVPEDNAEAAGDGEWEYVEIPEGEEETKELSGEEEWEWEYEEVSEDEPESAELSSQPPYETSPETSAKDAAFSDPYRSAASDTTIKEEENTSFTSMYNGEVYFQDKVYQNAGSPDAADTFKLPEDLAEGLGLPDLDNTDDNNEPYKPQGTI